MKKSVSPGVVVLIIAVVVIIIALVFVKAGGGGGAKDKAIQDSIAATVATKGTMPAAVAPKNGVAPAPTTTAPAPK